MSDGNRSGEGGSSSAPRGGSSVKEPIVEDISDDPIDLSDIPF